MYHKSTLRRMGPMTRRLAVMVNDLELQINRLKREVERAPDYDQALAAVVAAEGRIAARVEVPIGALVDDWRDLFEVPDTVTCEPHSYTVSLVRRTFDCALCDRPQDHANHITPALAA